MQDERFEVLISQQGPNLKNYAMRLTCDPEDAMDLVQDTFQRALKFSGSFEAGSNLRAWLFTIMKNTFINDCRKRKYVSERGFAYETSTLGKGEGNMVLKDIQLAIDSLPEEYYGPFSLYVEGYKYHEIAEQFHLPLGTVKTRIYTARKILRKKLMDYGL